MGNRGSDCLGCGDTQRVAWPEGVAVIMTLALGEWLRSQGTLAQGDKPPSVLKEPFKDGPGALRSPWCASSPLELETTLISAASPLSRWNSLGVL